jgi:chromate reductase
MSSHRIAVLVGSLRKASWNLKAANAMKALAPPELSLELLEIGNLPHYNEELDEEGQATPETWTRFRDTIRASNGVLFFTPEYNRSLPGVLKNAIDVGSRPGGKSAWRGKPGAVVSVSPYGLGGFGGNHALRQAMVFLDVPMMQQPEAYIANAGTLFSESGELTNDGTRALFTKFITRYVEWVDKFAKKS